MPCREINAEKRKKRKERESAHFDPIHLAVPRPESSRAREAPPDLVNARVLMPGAVPSASFPMEDVEPQQQREEESKRVEQTPEGNQHAQPTEGKAARLAEIPSNDTADADVVTSSGDMKQQEPEEAMQEAPSGSDSTASASADAATDGETASAQDITSAVSPLEPPSIVAATATIATTSVKEEEESGRVREEEEASTLTITSTTTVTTASTAISETEAGKASEMERMTSAMSTSIAEEGALVAASVESAGEKHEKKEEVVATPQQQHEPLKAEESVQMKTSEAPQQQPQQNGAGTVDGPSGGNNTIQHEMNSNPAVDDANKSETQTKPDVQQQTSAASSANRQMQFPYASSNFMSPAPTPIRPLHGDPRAMKQQQQETGEYAINDVSTTSTNEAAASELSNDTTTADGRSGVVNASYGVSQSQMFYHQTNAPSFYATPQDGPPLGPAMMDPSFEKQWQGHGSSSGTSMSNPNWNPQMIQGPGPSSERKSPAVPKRQGPSDPGLTPPPFAAKSLVPQRLDENSYALDRAILSRLGSYAKNVSTPAQASALAVDVLRATIDAESLRAHGWKDPFQGEEYEVLLQKGSIGLCMNMSVRMGSVTVTSFRRPDGGLVGPAEASGMIRIGDDLIAVDGFLVQSQEDFARVVSRLKSLRPVLLRFRRLGGNGLVSNLHQDVHGYRNGQRTSIVGLDNCELFTTGMWNMGVRYISSNQWAAELHVDGGGIRRLGVFSTEKEAAMAYNQYIHRTYGNGAIQFMNPAGTMSGSGVNAMPSDLPVAISNVRDMKPIQRPVRRPLLRAAFTTEQKEQLRAQIMVFKFTSTGGTIPNELLTRALKTTAHNYIQPGGDRKKRKNFTPHVVTKPAKKKAKKGRGKKKKMYSDEDEDESDSDENFSGPKVLKEERPARRSGRNVGKAKKKYVEDENNSAFELSDEEKTEKPQPKATPKGPQIDKIVSVRFHKGTQEDNDVAMEFLIKWKDASYLHVSWLTVRDIEEFGHHAVMRMKRYLQKNSRQVEDARESVVVGEEKDLSSYFSDAYIEVDRILNSKEVEEPEEANPYLAHRLKKAGSGGEDEGKLPLKKGVKYMVKWRDLSYVDCTWEWEDQLTDDRKIAAFHRYNHPPIINGAHPATYSDIRPEASTWAKYQESPNYNNQNTLRSYQLEGLNWMSFCWYNRRNCILADEMGLGKTVQATAILEHLRQREHIRGPFLVVAPLATLGNWKREIETWTSMNCVVYHDSEGGADIRGFIREQEFHFASEIHRRRGIYKFNVLVTSYQTLMMDAEYLDSIHWRYIVIDEAHKLKNREAKLLQVLRNFTWDSCLLMTGTPLQNGVFELWCLLNFIEPDKFPSQQEFYDEFGDLSTAEQVAQLHEQLRPYMLRRVKEDVEKSIPPKEETIVDVELTTLQKKYYRAIFERNRSFLNMGATGTVANLVNVEMELRKCCNHPFLIRGVEDKECARFDEQQRTKILIQASGKTVLLDKLLTKFHQENKKVLIFSQFKIMLDIIEDLCQLRGYTMERLDGSVRGNSRQAAIDRFNNPESDTFTFLLSTRAGGVGINLIAASVVILFDSDWNPQNDLQAVARCHRIGQTQSVNIYRLVTKKTYEAQMFEIASKKLGMHHAVFETGGVRNEFDGEDDSSGNMMSLMSLDREKVEMMIRYGAYAIMGEDDEQDPENRAINELDIDHLLSTSRTIRYDPTKTGENADDDENSGDGEGDAKPTPSQNTALSFSKATFTAESSDTTIDFNDEKFWEKVLGPKPVQQLMTKVQEGWFKTASQEDVKGFMSQLRDLARAVVQERQRGGSLADADQVLAILIELKVTGPILDGIINVREVANEWLEVIERPKRRRNQDVESELMYLEFLDGAKELSPTTTRKSKASRRKRGPKPNGQRRERKLYKSDDDEFDRENGDEIVAPKRKKAVRQVSGGRGSRGSSPNGRSGGPSGIRISLKRSKKGEHFDVVKVESSIRKVQKRLESSSSPGTSPQVTPVRGRKPGRRRKDEDEDEENSSGSEDDDEEEEAEEEDEEDEEEEEEEEDDEEVRKPARGRGRKKGKVGRPRKLANGSIDPQEDEEMWCRVCFSDQGFLDDPIVQCEKCSVAVHKYCYGIQAVPEGDTPWFCDFCAESSGSPADATCELCPLKRQKSAFKKTCEGKWAHVVCALWAPGVQFADVERMSGVKYVAAAVAETKGPACAVCEETDGCIKCSRGPCETYFHPLCGRESKGDYDMFMNEGGQLRAFCPKHRSHRKRAS